MARSVLVAGLLSSALGGCIEAASSSEACGRLRFEHPVLVLESEYGGTASALGRLGVDGCLTEVGDIALPNNALLRGAHGRPFFLDDDAGVLHALSATKLALEGTFAAYKDSPEEKPNPHDVDVDGSGRLWIARYDKASLALVEPDGAWAGEVDLGDLDPDGIPDMDAVHVAGERVHVSLELLDRGVTPAKPRRTGAIAIVGAAPPHPRIGVIDLAGKNPFGPLVPLDAGGSIVAVATPGRFDAVDAQDGVDAVDLDAGKARQIVSEAALSGSVWEVAVASPTEAYALVLGPMDPNPTRVVPFDPTTGKVGPPLLSLPAFQSAGIAVDGDKLLVGDFTKGKAKIHVFDRATASEIGAITPKLMPPWSFLRLGP